jgi:hypothetical protein
MTSSPSPGSAVNAIEDYSKLVPASLGRWFRTESAEKSGSYDAPRPGGSLIPLMR